MHTQIYTYTHTHIYTYTHIHIHTYTHTHIHTYTHTHIHTYTHTHIYTYTHIHIHTYTHTHIHTHTHTHTRKKVNLCFICSAGTPIPGKLDDFHGILRFLHHNPFAEVNINPFAFPPLFLFSKYGLS